jgi:hypothetical protein
MENITVIEAFIGVVNTSAIITFLYLFVTGKVQSEKVVDRILDEAENRTIKHSKEILDGMEDAIYTGYLKAMKEYNGEDKNE